MLFILALFAVFMISALFIVLFGARIYKKVVADADTNYNARTSIAYISEKIRQHDSEDGVSVAHIVEVIALESARDPRHVDVVEVDGVEFIAPSAPWYSPSVSPGRREHPTVELGPILHVVTEGEF